MSSVSDMVTPTSVGGLIFEYSLLLLELASYMAASARAEEDGNRQNEKIKHEGGCHCGAVRFEVMAPVDVEVYDCK